jgi:hypothetical protein
MKKIGSQTRETLKESGYKLIQKNKDEVILQDKEDGHFEIWAKNNHHAGYTIDIKGVGYEYVRRTTLFGIKPKSR